MSRYLTPTPDAEDARHRGEVREQTVDWRTEVAHELGRRCVEPLDADALHRGARLRRMAAAVADESHPLHDRAVVDLEQARQHWPLEVALAVSIVNLGGAA